MIKESDFTTRSQGSEPFKVPEGYFADFPAQMMARIDSLTEAKPKKLRFYQQSWYLKLRPYLYLAATMCGLYFGIWVFKYQQRLAEQKAQATVSQQDAAPQDSYFDDAYDYMMPSRFDVIACVTDAE